MSDRWLGWAKFAVPLLLAFAGYLWNSSVQTARLEERLAAIERNTQSHDVLLEKRVDRIEDRMLAGR